LYYGITQRLFLFCTLPALLRKAKSRECKLNSFTAYYNVSVPNGRVCKFIGAELFRALAAVTGLSCFISASTLPFFLKVCSTFAKLPGASKPCKV